MCIEMKLNLDAIDMYSSESEGLLLQKLLSLSDFCQDFDVILDSLTCYVKRYCLCEVMPACRASQTIILPCLSQRFTCPGQLGKC